MALKLINIFYFGFSLIDLYQAVKVNTLYTLISCTENMYAQVYK